MSVGRRMLSVGGAHMLELALQFVLPVVLVRVLTPADFGVYRLVWLLVSTIGLIAPLGMISTLFFFMPNADRAERRGYVRQTEAFLVLTSLACLALLWLVHAWLPSGLAAAASHGAWLVALAVFWTWGLLLDQLPTVDERIRWQVAATMVFSVSRALCAVTVAWVFRDVHHVIVALALMSLLKVVILQVYVARFHGSTGQAYSAARLRTQIAHALPFGAAGILFGARSQAEQWIVALLFAPAQFAAFSIAAALAPVVLMSRKAVSFVLLPAMSRELAAGNHPALLLLSNQTSTTVAAVLYPVLGFTLFFAGPMIELVYTRSMADGANVMRMLLAIWALQAIDLSSLTMLLKQGGFMTRVNVLLLAASVPLSWAAAQVMGLPGGVLGGVLAIYVERWLTARRIAAALGVSARQLQPWASLLLLAAFSVACAGLGWLAADTFGAGTAWRMLVVGAIVTAACYAPVFWWLRRAGHIVLPGSS